MRYCELQKLDREPTMTTFVIHLEAVEPRDIVWWAEAAAIPGLSVAAPSLKELRRLVDEAVAIHLEPNAQIEYLLAAPETMPHDPVETLLGQAAVPVDTGQLLRTQFLPLTA